MSNFFTGKGKEIIKKREEEEQKKLEQEKRKQEQNEIKKLRKNFKIGDKAHVALPNSETYVEFWNHSSYTLSQNYQIYPCVCTKHLEPDAYDKAIDYLYKVKNNLEDKELEHAEFLIRELKAKRRYMFGFWNLETGQPMVVETTGKQGDDLVDRILELEDDEKLDYELLLEKVGSGTDVKYKLSIIRGSNKKPVKVDLSEFGEFDTGLFEKMVFNKDDEWKVKDLVKLGFDVTKIGYEKSAQNEQIKQNAKRKEQQQNVISDDDLPF